jgi:hypothetical protein
MPAPSSLRSGASFQCQARKIKDLTEHDLIKHSSKHHKKDRILVPALGIEGALVQGNLQCPRCPELSCTPEAWDYHVNVNHEFEVGELPTCLVRPLFDGNWHQVHQKKTYSHFQGCKSSAPTASMPSPNQGPKVQL